MPTGPEPPVHTHVAKPVTPLACGLTPIVGAGSPTDRQTSPIVGGCATTGAGGGASGAAGIEAATQTASIVAM